MSARRLLEQHPRRVDRPSQQRGGVHFIKDVHTRERDGLAYTVALDDERARVLNVHDANHSCIQGHCEQKRDENSMHAFFVGARKRTRAPRTCGLRWEREHSTGWHWPRSFLSYAKPTVVMDRHRRRSRPERRPPRPHRAAAPQTAAGADGDRGGVIGAPATGRPLRRRLVGARATGIAPFSSSKPVEVQLRTQLQHVWAEMCEKCADVFDPAVKYGGGPDELRRCSIELPEKSGVLNGWSLLC